MPSAPHRTQFKKRRETEFWHRINRLIFFLILITIGGLIFLSFYPEWKRLKELRQNTNYLKQELTKKEQLLRTKSTEVDLLQNDPNYLEIIARDRLDMMKDGETIYRLDSKPNKATSPIPVPAASAHR
ncbi:MAG: septum formation initiator family protein [Chthoniobacterales bacterium]